MAHFLFALPYIILTSQTASRIVSLSGKAYNI